MVELGLNGEVTRRAAPAPGRWGAVSVAVHAALVLAVVGVLGRHRAIVAYKLPGSVNGVESLAVYNPGSALASQSQVTVKKAEAKAVATVKQPELSVPKPVEAAAARAESGSANAPLSGVGEGEISLALEKFFPYPKPDLSALPHGTRGDVIVDAVVGEDGKIADLKVVQGLGPAINDVVVATVRQWLYTPATRNGVPVASAQELHFHYERS